jgi:sulfonate transport system ATP-binding protein
MLRLTKVGKRFPGGHQALAGIDLEIAAGEIVTVVGASGCGKSTLLRLLAGLDRPSEGRIALHGTPLDGPSPEIGVVFQEPRLMPWLTVAQNVAFGLRGPGREERRRLALAALQRVHLEEFADALPRALSGGMAQRTAIARALVARPPVLLLDEPFSALDALTRESLQDELLQIWSDDRPTLILVTHDIDEALALGDRVVVLGGRPGRIQAILPVDLPRPRVRTSHGFQAQKEVILGMLSDLHASRRAAA